MIEIKELTHQYATSAGAGPLALDGIDLAFAPGTFNAILGANGSGKTTLARHLNALLLPTRGSVHVAGLDTRSRANWPAIRSQVAMVFQYPEDQIVATTVEDDVAFGPENLGVPPDEIEQRVRWALDTVGMWQLRQRPPHLLSAGQQQRVAIAGALAMRPDCLVLDEATAMLDPSGRHAVLALLAELKVQGLTILLITHFMNEAGLAERAIVLRTGQVVFDGTPRTLFAGADGLASLNLNPTPVTELAAALARRWPGFPTDSLTVDELADNLVAHLVRNGHTTTHLAGAPAGHNGGPLVVVRDLHHTYLPGTPLSTRALQDVNLEIWEGEVLAVLGPTGSGKSSLLQHIAGLLRPSGGEVTVNGHPVGALQSGVQHQTVAMLFQKPEEQLFETYVGDDVAFGPRQIGMDHAAVRERVRRAMEVVGLPFEEFKDRFTQSLSGGEKRKAALAGVLALQPRVLLLDEPTAGLDPEGRRQLLVTLRHLNRHEGTTLVLATHTMEDVALLADRALVLDEGRIVAQGTPRQLFQDPARLAAHGLEVPQVTALMHRLRSRGLAVPSDVLTVQEALAVLGGQPNA